VTIIVGDTSPHKRADHQARPPFGAASAGPLRPVSGRPGASA
jgi:hypothetical protein